MTTSTRYESLDHWRGVACLAVLVTHSVWSRTGTSFELTIESVAARLWIGVPVFFVISGYCISAAVESHLRRGRGMASYFARRLRRIFPPYWYVLGGTALLVGILDVLGAPMIESGEFMRPWWYDLRQWVGNATLTETWRFHVLPGQKALFLGHAWTLCYEEQFYAVAGVLLWMFRARWFAAGVGVSVLVGIVSLTKDSLAWSVDGFFFDGLWFQFWFGMLLYHALHHADRVGRAIIIGLFAAVLIVTSADPAALLAREKNDVQGYWIAAAFALTAALLHRFDQRLAMASNLRFFKWCGVMCYSLYLVHLPLVKCIHVACFWVGFQPTPLISLLLCVPASLWVSWRFHLAVERRFLNPRADAPVIRAFATPAGATP